MKNNNATNARLSKDGKLMIVSVGGQTTLLNVNLVKYLLGVPYTKKDGTPVSKTEIASMKQRSREAYSRAVLNNTATA